MQTECESAAHSLAKKISKQKLRKTGSGASELNTIQCFSCSLFNCHYCQLGELGYRDIKQTLVETEHEQAFVKLYNFIKSFFFISPLSWELLAYIIS